MNKNRSAWSPLTSILSHPSLRLATEGRGSIFYVNLFSKIFELLPYQSREQEEAEKRWFLTVIGVIHIIFEFFEEFFQLLIFRKFLNSLFEDSHGFIMPPHLIKGCPHTASRLCPLQPGWGTYPCPCNVGKRDDERSWIWTVVVNWLRFVNPVVFMGSKRCD